MQVTGGLCGPRFAAKVEAFSSPHLRARRSSWLKTLPISFIRLDDAVGDGRRDSGFIFPVNKSFLFQQPQPLRQNARRNSFHPEAKDAEARRAIVAQRVEDVQRP